MLVDPRANVEPSGRSKRGRLAFLRNTSGNGTPEWLMIVLMVVVAFSCLWIHGDTTRLWRDIGAEQQIKDIRGMDKNERADLLDSILSVAGFVLLMLGLFYFGFLCPGLWEKLDKLLGSSRRSRRLKQEEQEADD